MIERICLILLANLVFFSKSLTYQYTSDDIPVWQESQKMKLGFWKKRFLQIEGGIRVDPQQDHLLTTVIHALVCVFIYVTFGANDVSFIAAFLFAFNPINNQGSVWISGRTYPLTALLIMATMVFPIIAPLSILAVMHYPIGFVMASILIIYKPILGMFVLIGAVWHSRRFKDLIKRKRNFEMFDEDKKISFKKIILVIKTYSFYTVHSILPLKTTFYHSFMQSMAGSGAKKAYSFDRFFYIGIVLACATAYKIFLTPWDMVSFGLCWWVIGLAPFLNAFRISQEIAERYAYAPLVGLMLALASVLAGHPVIICLFITMYATKLWFWMDAFQDDFYLVEHSCMSAPDAWFVWHIRALKRWDVQSHKEAMIMWTMARRISPNEFKVLFNLATMLKIHNHDKEADKFMKEAEDNIPKGQEKESGDLVKEWKNGEYKVLI